jgi:hypothetical protein
MKSHGIDFIGKVLIQRVPALLPWTSEDPGRVVLNEADEIVYIGGSVSWGNWIKVGRLLDDSGIATDPDTGASYFSRKYILNVENGNIILEYDI